MMRRPTGPAPVCRGLLILAVTAASACTSGGDPVSHQAKRVCRDTMNENPQYATYAVTEAANSDSEFARQILGEAVGSEDFESSLAAVRGLATNPGPAARDLLQQAFEQKKGPVRLWAAIGLVRLEDEAARQWLLGQLGETGGAVKFDAAVALARQGERQAIEEMLVRMMSSGEQPQQDEAYAMLGRIGEPWAKELLLEGLDSEHGEDRREAIRALGRTGDPALAPRLARFANTQGLVFATLETLGELGNPEVAKTIRQMVDREEPLLKVYSGVALWKLGALEDPLEVLGSLTVAEDVRVRLTLAEQLGSIEGDDRAVQMLAALLEDQGDPEVRLAAARALDELSPEGVEPYLVAAASDPDYRVAVAALEALRGSANEQVPEQLLPVLENENPYVRISAALTVLDIRGRKTASVEG